MEDYEIERPEIIEKCKGYTLNLLHPAIKIDEEYQIHAFKEMEGKYGDFFLLYCYIPGLNKYQRVFSNSYLSKQIADSMPIWTRYEKEYNDTFIWQGKHEMMKFYPGEIKNYMGNNYRKVLFDIE